MKVGGCSLLKILLYIKSLTPSGDLKLLGGNSISLSILWGNNFAKNCLYNSSVLFWKFSQHLPENPNSSSQNKLLQLKLKILSYYVKFIPNKGCDNLKLSSIKLIIIWSCLALSSSFVWSCFLFSWSVLFLTFQIYIQFNIFRDRFHGK